ncbi:MAG TPA: anti-sigma factor [Terriglobales bacterium]|nr:anti-sigma factor [Terriglobales bacterium]
MSAHEQFAEDLALYALGALKGNDLVDLEKHLADCPACRNELAALRGDMALMALSTAGATPPKRSEQRLMDAIHREPRAIKARKAGGRWWGALGWVSAVVMAAAAFWFWRQSDSMALRLAKMQNQFSAQTIELQKASEIVATLTAPDAQVVNVAAPNTPPQPQGKAIYVRDRSSLVFIASNLPTPPSQKAYELWLIPTQGAPIPAGVFKPNARGNATIVNPPLPANVQAKAFALTIEPEAGSITPTMPILLVGQGE